MKQLTFEESYPLLSFINIIRHKPNIVRSLYPGILNMLLSIYPICPHQRPRVGDVDGGWIPVVFSAAVHHVQRAVPRRDTQHLREGSVLVPGSTLG